MTEAARKTFVTKFFKVCKAEPKAQPWKIMQWLQRCLARRDFLNVFEASGAEEGGDPEEAEDLEVAILRALFRATKAQIRAHEERRSLEKRDEPDKWSEGALSGLLQLAVQWDRFELAQQLLFQSSGVAAQPAAAVLAGGVDEERQLSKADFLKALPNALQQDRHAFVREFIQRGLEMEKFFPFDRDPNKIAKPTHYNNPLFDPLALLYKEREVCTRAYAVLAVSISFSLSASASASTGLRERRVP